MQVEPSDFEWNAYDIGKCRPGPLLLGVCGG